MQLKTIRIVASIAVMLSFIVVMLGAYTRLTDAGLGCPDWPGCYGKLILPNAADDARIDAQAAYPDMPIESEKAWTEMTHRYVAGTLGVLILILATASRFGPKAARLSPVFSVSLIGLLFFQAALGMWTVTLQLLPVVVMGHLLGGMTLAALMVGYRWHLSAVTPVTELSKKWRIAAGFGLMVLALQIALGGWVSANYAGLACLGFPTCNQHWLPVFDFHRAFNLFSPLGANYQGGALELVARVTIQWTHRVWAIVTLLYLLSIGVCALRCFSMPHVRWIAGFILGGVLLQCLLGIFNVIYMLPLPVAVAHNGVALLLLSAMVSLYYFVSRGRL